MSIHLSGSVAYDRIMTFSGQFEDYLLPEKLHTLNVCFLIDRIEEKRGGTAGNIAYNLALLKEKPCIYACVGKDFTGYDKALEELGISLAGIRRLEDGFTACAYITTDKKGNQITGFSPAAMNTPCDPSFWPRPAAGDWALVGPGNVEDMRVLPALYRDTKTPYIFDPGQQVPALTPQALLEGFSGAALLIGNDYEIELIGTMTGMTKGQMLEHVDFLITTLGDAGSEVASRNWEKPRRIAPISVPHVADPTGAGDAYRGGMLKALHAGLDMEVAARIGTVCASFCVEKYGTQEHSFTREGFVKRYESAYGPFPSLSW